MNFNWEDETDMAHICFNWDFPEECDVYATVRDKDGVIIADGSWPSSQGGAVMYNIPYGPTDSILILGVSDSGVLYRHERSSVYLVQNVCTPVDATEPVYFIPDLVLPPDGAIFLDNVLEWSPVDEADVYRVEISESEDFSSIVISEDMEATQCTPAVALPSTRYYWRVIAIDEYGNDGVPSAVRFFETPPADADIAAYYPFNGSADDQSGNLNHGTVFGPVLTEDRFGNQDEAYSFDGVDDYISIPHDMSLNSSSRMTITAWIRPESGTSEKFIVNKLHAFSLDIYPGTVRGLFSRAGYQSATFDTDGTSAIQAGEWQHIAASCSEYFVKVYYDGMLESSKSTGSGIKTSEEDLNFGKYLFMYFHGAMDDVRIYHRILSDAEIIEMYEKTDASF